MSFNTIFRNDFFHITVDKRGIYNIRYNTKLDFMIPTSLYQEERIDGKTLHDKKYFNLKLSNIPIMTLGQYLNSKEGQLSYIDINNLIIQVGNQISEIERNNITVPFIEPVDIIVINNYFLYLGVNVITIKDNTSVIISKPYTKNIFFSPEMISINSLPSNVSKKSWIYSLGMICIFCLSKDKRLNGKNNEELMGAIKDIESTKLYFCIERCINSNPNKRFYYYI